MSQSKKLRNFIRSKKPFEVDSKQDLEVFSNFLKHGGWGKEGCPFVSEEPFISIPDMIKDKIARKYLGI
jgi:hypothetical protein